MPPKAKVKKDDSTADGYKMPVVVPREPCDPWKTFGNAMHTPELVDKILAANILGGVNQHIFERDFVPKIRPFVIRATLMDLQKGTCFHHYLQD